MTKKDYDWERELAACITNGCTAKSQDNRCHQECNTAACDFDGGDCSLGLNPWRNCTTTKNCWQVFADGRCDAECNTPECLYDGRDCERTLMPCKYVFYILLIYCMFNEYIILICFNLF